MKRTIIVLAALFMTIPGIKAQEFRLGVASGMDASTLSLSGGSGGILKFKSGITAGLLAEAKISPVFGIQLEANYSSQGSGIVDQEDELTAGSFQFEYLTIPVLAKLYGNPRFSVFAGPQIGILLKAEQQQSNEEDRDVKEFLKSTDFYAVFGSEYRFANGIFISGRYNFGFTNIIDSEQDGKLKNRYFSVRIGYSVKL